MYIIFFEYHIWRKIVYRVRGTIWGHSWTTCYLMILSFTIYSHKLQTFFSINEKWHWQFFLCVAHCRFNLNLNLHFFLFNVQWTMRGKVWTTASPLNAMFQSSPKTHLNSTCTCNSGITVPNWLVHLCTSVSACRQQV
jgi:hypothetical protein